MKMFIDDLRKAPNDYIVCRSSKEAISFVKENGCPEFISFDHDLGGEDTSMIFVDWLINAALDGSVSIPDGFDYWIHSANPIGAKNIEIKLGNFIKFLRSESTQNN